MSGGKVQTKWCEKGQSRTCILGRKMLGEWREGGHMSLGVLGVCKAGCSIKALETLFPD